MRGLAVAAGLVTLSTLAVFALKGVAPVGSLSVVYLIAVLVASVYWGRWLGVATSMGSAAAFNFFFLDPTGRFTIADSRNVVALLAFLVVAVVVSSIAQTARSRSVEAEARRREADLAATLARTLLGGPLEDTVGQAAHEIATTLGAASVTIELGEQNEPGLFCSPGHLALPLRDGGDRLGWLVVPAGVDASRIVPALELVLVAALARDRLQAEVVETASLRRSDELKTALLRSVSHDLRTPVTAAMAGARALRSMAPGDPERAEVEGDILDATTRLSRLIDQLLDLARLQGGSAEPRTELCSVEEVLREAAEQAGDFVWNIDAGLPLVSADAAQLERAFANLLENAVRHGGEQPVGVRVRAAGDHVQVRVVDHGPGIPAHEQERIFSPFYGRGSGLGLAIARGFVEANGGRLHVESLPGQGATFVVDL